VPRKHNRIALHAQSCARPPHAPQTAPRTSHPTPRIETPYRATHARVSRRTHRRAVRLPSVDGMLPDSWLVFNHNSLKDTTPIAHGTATRASTCQSRPPSRTCNKCLNHRGSEHAAVASTARRTPSHSTRKAAWARALTDTHDRTQPMTSSVAWSMTRGEGAVQHRKRDSSARSQRCVHITAVSDARATRTVCIVSVHGVCLQFTTQPLHGTHKHSHRCTQTSLAVHKTAHRRRA
jgi:hypothetical protein